MQELKEFKDKEISLLGWECRPTSCAGEFILEGVRSDNYCVTVMIHSISDLVWSDSGIKVYTDDCNYTCKFAFAKNIADKSIFEYLFKAEAPSVLAAYEREAACQSMFRGLHVGNVAVLLAVDGICFSCVVHYCEAIVIPDVVVTTAPRVHGKQSIISVDGEAFFYTVLTESGLFLFANEKVDNVVVLDYTSKNIEAKQQGGKLTNFIYRKVESLNDFSTELINAMHLQAPGIRAVTTRDVIAKLQAYEEQYGVGVITDIEEFSEGGVMYSLIIANDSRRNFANAADHRYREVTVELDAVRDADVFPDRFYDERIFKGE